VFRQLALDGFSLTKMRKFAAEKDERLRTRYWEVMTQEVWFPEQLVFIDETSKDGRTLRRSHGRSLKGTRIEQRETIMRGRRISVLGVLATTGFLDFHWVVKGYSAEEFLYAAQSHSGGIWRPSHRRPVPPSGVAPRSFSLKKWASGIGGKRRRRSNRT